mgnify:CR=1 FL=1
MAFIFLSTNLQAQQATVGVTLIPAGSFKAKSTDVKGFATKKGDEVSAKNIVVDLKDLKTGVDLRDKHTKKHLETDKFPQAILVSATGKGGKGTGVIKIRGIEKNIAGTYKVEGNTLVAQFPLVLSEFGITGIKYMGVGVDDEVRVQVSVPIK